MAEALVMCSCRFHKSTFANANMRHLAIQLSVLRYLMASFSSSKTLSNNFGGCDVSWDMSDLHQVQDNLEVAKLVLKDRPSKPVYI
jgi:hypothetical protein